MSQTEHKPLPGALELARHVLNIGEGAENPIITSVEIHPDLGGTFHYITGPDNKQSRIGMYGDGTFSACHMNADGTRGTGEIMNGQIHETSAEPVIRAHTEEIVAALTGHKVKTQGSLQVYGVSKGRYLSPVNVRDSMNDHNFLYHEDALGGFTLSKTMPEMETNTTAFEGSPLAEFAKGNVADVLSQDVRYTCKLRITDQELFNDEMAISSIEEFNSKIALENLLVYDSILSLADVGIDSLDVQDIEINTKDNDDFISMTVIAKVKDHCAMTAKARDAYAKNWQNNNWYPESAEEALWELTLASNDNPCPSDFGFEIKEMEPVDPASEVKDPEVADVLPQDVRYTCKLRITDRELFNDEMAISSIAEFNSKVALEYLLVYDSILSLADVGIDSLDVQDIEINIEDDDDFISMTVIAKVNDQGLMTAKARDAYAENWQDEKWYPESPEEALWELTLASNDNPCPSDFGFEIKEMEPAAPVSEVKHPESDISEMSP